MPLELVAVEAHGRVELVAVRMKVQERPRPELEVAAPALRQLSSISRSLE
jgi:hypothetical protein